MVHDLTGKLLGSCLLEKQIGQGGMGVVYLARQTRPARYVAVKVLMPKIITNSETYQRFLARFRREADVIARLEHVNIMPIYEYGEQEGLGYLVMPYLPNGSLRDILTKRGALSLQETVTYIDQAASALDYAHAHRVIHRDIKPSNFLLHSDGRLVLTDFGIARIMQDDGTTVGGGTTLTGAGMFLGTPEYMAPEMARGELVDHRADIYELGVVLFQMLSGHVPFKANTPVMVLAMQLQEQLPALHELNPAIPVAVDTVVQKATAKNREDRYLSAGALASDLHIASVSSDYLPTVRSQQSPRPIGLPPQASAYEPVPQATYPMNYTTTPFEAQSRDAGQPGIPITPPVYGSPTTPYSLPETRRRSRPWLFPLILLLIVALGTGGLFLVLHLKPSTTVTPTPIVSPATPLPTTSTTLTPSTASTATPTSSPTQQAQALVQQYYNDINARDYQSAYNLWSTSYQQANPYAPFASGYAHTLHDDVTFGSIITLSDGTIQVYVTIQALETSSSGQASHTYQGYYTVGQQNGAWKLLNGNIQQTA